MRIGRRRDSSLACRQLAATPAVRQGIIVQRTFLVGEKLAADRLVEILPDCRRPEAGIYAVYPSRE